MNSGFRIAAQRLQLFADRLEDPSDVARELGEMLVEEIQTTVPVWTGDLRAALEVSEVTARRYYAVARIGDPRRLPPANTPAPKGLLAQFLKEHPEYKGFYFGNVGGGPRTKAQREKAGRYVRKARYRQGRAVSRIIRARTEAKHVRKHGVTKAERSSSAKIIKGLSASRAQRQYLKAQRGQIGVKAFVPKQYANNPEYHAIMSAHPSRSSFEARVKYHQFLASKLTGTQVRVQQQKILKLYQQEHKQLSSFLRRERAKAIASANVPRGYKGSFYKTFKPAQHPIYGNARNVEGQLRGLESRIRDTQRRIDNTSK